MNRLIISIGTVKKFLLYFWWIGILLISISSCNSIENSKKEIPVPDLISYNLHIRPILSDNCFACHGPDANKREAGLRLDVAEEAFKALQDNPMGYVMVPGKPKDSDLYRRISSPDRSERMPPPESNLKLSNREITLIEKWIRQGANYEPHWAYLVPQKSTLPIINNREWARNEIDYFIAKKQQELGLEPNPEAEKEMLLRRVSLDLTGLPPDIDLMDRFLEDKRENAYELIVDELLRKESYGEKMAVHWMDIARYADSHGYQDDNFRSQWPWRDWVIHAFNQNLPFDQFISWQLAGDLLPNPSKEQVLATGFNRNHKITEEGGVIDEEYRVEYVVDRTNTFGKSMLGITLECAQCHDHKYDPLSQKEYYQLYGFFNSIREVGHESNVGGPETYAKNPKIEITEEDLKGILSFVNKRDSLGLIVSVMGDLDSARTTYILNRGAYDGHGEVVQNGTPNAILPFNANLPRNRLGLSNWLLDEGNPLTSRVFVNRIWQEIFGRGIVNTPGDFGMQGELPSHPELLDWLAVDFRENGWDIKRLIRLIVTSATYRQSSIVTEEKLMVDPENIFYSRAPRYRMKAEFIRDLVFSSSGLLVDQIGGPSVKPYQPPGLWEAAASTGAKFGILGTYIQDKGESLYRRGLYTFIKRTLPPPSMVIFDGSNRDVCELERSVTNTPLQALVMMNDPTVLEASRVLAEKLLMEKSGDKEKIYKAFRLVVGRKPDSRELEILQEYFNDQKVIFGQHPGNAKKIVEVGEFPLKDELDIIPFAAMAQVISTLYNLEETITKS